jgi:hypothetical protein
MTPAEGMGTIYGSVTIINGAKNQSVMININEKQDDDSVVEVTSASVANGGTYFFDLPPGVYSMFAVFNANGEEMTLEANEAFEIIDGEVIEFDILFENIEDEDSDAADDSDTSDSGKPEKVTICHKGRTITISSSALQAHLNHGDTEGGCGEVDNDSEDPDDGTDDDEEEPDDGGDTTDESESDEGADDAGRQKVTICHKGRTINVNESALQAHLNHGDTEGGCGEVYSDSEDPDDGTDDDEEGPDDDGDTTDEPESDEGEDE